MSARLLLNPPALHSRLGLRRLAVMGGLTATCRPCAMFTRPLLEGRWTVGRASLPPAERARGARP